MKEIFCEVFLRLSDIGIYRALIEYRHVVASYRCDDIPKSLMILSRYMLIVPSYKPREYPSSSEISTIRDDEMTILRKERKDSSILIGNSIERMESCNIIATYHKKDSVILIMLYECYLTR